MATINTKIGILQREIGAFSQDIGKIPFDLLIQSIDSFEERSGYLQVLVARLGIDILSEIEETQGIINGYLNTAQSLNQEGDFEAADGIFLQVSSSFEPAINQLYTYFDTVRSLENSLSQSMNVLYQRRNLSLFPSSMRFPQRSLG